MPNAEDKLEQALKAVWRQALVERARTVELDGQYYPVRRTPRRGLAQVDFSFHGREIRGLEQNPDTKSRWAQLARSGKKVMQFLEGGRYIANVAGGDVTVYGKSKPRAHSSRQSSYLSFDSAVGSLNRRGRKSLCDNTNIFVGRGFSHDTRVWPFD